MAEQAKEKGKTFRLEIVTPERVVVEEDVEGVVIPSQDGLLGILRNHAPIIGGLDIGVIKYVKEGQPHYVACGMGVFEMSGNVLRILPDTAERGERIDVERAKQARQRAEKRLREKAEGLDVLRAELALRRSLARLKAAEAAGKMVK
ncbi:ATP synthase F1complex subunit epsilon [Thermacetogenium phaeum DSM 12270]|uniref:ATP synthase epsilon chain n=1 Tax=Thermacetogenium phaeum (strain ATCC BAA-254 / DSM 26808 / PB) TaxID=1089553 RepID=K4LIT1_THEPS|nr:F0F1 ATP synthase subunit epsilon [Thermacetogenium phaeum]AFV12901.1 ATP synthase F1complex subunit epsilon [Thermacetogenium phaeum DSM 12270]